MATTNELNEKMWQTFGHGSPAFRQANHRQKEGILYVRQIIKRSNDESGSQMNSDSMPKEGVAEGNPVSLPEPHHTPLREIPLNELYGLSDKAWRSRTVDYWCDHLETAELESIRDALDVALVEREDSDAWEEVVLADDEREEEATKTE